MVRVISVHHFASQHVQTVEQPTACAIAPPDRLLLALSAHCVEVRDLKNEADVLFTFPTVEEVTQMVHCLNGNYVATVEAKRNRQGRNASFVRVYVNWDSIATLQQSKMTSSGVSLGSSECGMVQPMRARIAGRVTPTTNQSELGSLEMIEMPTRDEPDAIECCQVSGNVLILAKNLITIYAFRVKIHDISKLRFVDFEELPVYIELDFTPNQIAVCENYVACISADCLHMFKVVPGATREATGSANDSGVNFKYAHPDAKVDYRKLLREERPNGGDRVTVNLPTIVKGNSTVHRHSPFTFCDKEMEARIGQSSPGESWAQSYRIRNLIQLKLVPIVIENANGQVAEEFKCMVLKPLYVDAPSKRRGDSGRLLSSEHRHHLSGVACVVATQQEGYLYHFDDTDCPDGVDNCISVYPFTAPVQKIVLEDCFLHALTEAGLESYTHRIGHRLCRSLEPVDDVASACPPVSDPICLVGLRPFLGVEKMLLSNANLVLLANADGSPTHSVGSNSSSNTAYWTLYDLELPTPKMIFNDVSIVANVHRFTSSQTYRHLMSEAHMVLRNSLVLLKWTLAEGNVTLIAPAKANADDLADVYRTSCALLGDHFIMCSGEDYALALPYYRMARMLPMDILKRVKKLQDQSNNQSMKGLLYYLKRILLEVRLGPQFDRLFGAGSRQNFAEAILELFEQHNYKELPNLILKSSILREYSSEKLIGILDGQTGESVNRSEKLLALAVLHAHRCNLKKAQAMLDEIPKATLFDMLLENYELLFEPSWTAQNRHRAFAAFSELTQILMSDGDFDVLPELFVALMDRKVVGLGKLLKVFLEYLPSSIGTDGNAAGLVLQKTLEMHLRKYFARNDNSDPTRGAHDRCIGESLKLLVRSYLSQLQIMQLKENSAAETGDEQQSSQEEEEEAQQLKEDESRRSETFSYNRVNRTFFEEAAKKGPTESYLFAELRHAYLDEMPPFRQDDFKKKAVAPNPEADLILKKLQALLCCEALSRQVASETDAFLAISEGLRGSESLRSIGMAVNEAVLFLVDVCPQCLLQYGKDRFSKTEEWKFLVATVQQRIICLRRDESSRRACHLYKKILKDMLTHVATSMNLEQLVQVFPQRLNAGSEYVKWQNAHNLSEVAESNRLFADADDVLDEIQNYEPYITACKETMHANQIKKLIAATGQQLLCTLNL